MATSLMANDNSHDLELENILTNRRDRIYALVEDESDVAIWKDLLLSVWPQKKFHVSTFGSSSQKGKAGILKKASKFGPTMIGCIDSDYDWILDRYTPIGMVISSNKFILQTMAYGVENLLLQPSDIAACVRIGIACDCDAFDCLDGDYKEILKEVSKIIYRPLMWHLIRIKAVVDYETVSDDWMRLFSSKNYEGLINDDKLTFNEIWNQIISELKHQTDLLIADYESRYSSLRNDMVTLEEELRNCKDLTEENAYLFAPTHLIFDFLYYVFFYPLEKRVKNEHIMEIMSKLPHDQARKEAQKHYLSQCMSFKNLRRKKYEFLFNQSAPIIDAIKRDVRACLQ